MGRHPDHEMDARVIALAAQGMTVSMIARVLDADPSSTRQRAIRLGLTLPSGSSDVWNTGKVNTLKRMWGEGKPTSAIGLALGVSKNAVIGKAHRLGLPARPSPIRRKA